MKDRVFLAKTTSVRPSVVCTICAAIPLIKKAPLNEGLIALFGDEGFFRCSAFEQPSKHPSTPAFVFVTKNQ